MNSNCTLSIEDVKETEQAKLLHAQLAAIGPKEVPILSRDRHLPRTEQARLARELMKQRGLKGISITTPRYSMASTVRITLPRRRDYTLDGFGSMEPGCEAAVANSQARDRILAILLAAFPNHNDRSDSATDYFDYCWSVE